MIPRHKMRGGFFGSAPGGGSSVVARNTTPTAFLSGVVNSAVQSFALPALPVGKAFRITMWGLWAGASGEWLVPDITITDHAAAVKGTGSNMQIAGFKSGSPFYPQFVMCQVLFQNVTDQAHQTIEGTCAGGAPPGSVTTAALSINAYAIAAGAFLDLSQASTAKFQFNTTNTTHGGTFEYAIAELL
jgi:hypothetical protein